MKNEMVPLDFHQIYSFEEFDLIRQGYIGDQDSKWFIYFDNGCLSVYYGNREHGTLYFTLKFKVESDHVSVSEAWILANAPWDGEEGVRLLADIIDSRFDLVTVCIQKENIGPVSFWLKRNKLVLISNYTSTGDLMDANSVLKLGKRLIEVAAVMNSVQNH